MKEKIYKVMINYVNIMMIILILCLPLFLLHDDSNGVIIKDKTLFGFNFINGYVIKDASKDAINGNMIPVLKSSPISMIPMFALLAMFAIDKIPNKSFGKEIISTTLCVAGNIVLFILPVIAPLFLYETYKDYLDFKIMWGFVVVLILYTLLSMYYIYHLVILIVEHIKEIRAQY